MFYVFLAISLIFVVVVLFKHLLKLRICALCAAIALTWVILLVLFKTGRFHDQVLLSLLMGQSVTGIFYFVQKRLPKTLRIFSLPFFLSLTVVFYLLITSNIILPVFILLTVLWAAAWLVFSWRNDPAKAPIARAAIECCEDDK